MIPERWVLMLDGESSPLGGVALELVRLGIDTMYAKDLDEATLLASQERERLAGLLLPSGLSLPQLERVVERLGRFAPIDFGSVALLGPQLAPPERQARVKKGIRWCLWSPFDEAGLRFIAKASLWAGSDDDLRLDLRVPTNLMADVQVGEERRRALVGDLAAGGAYLETPSPFTPGSRVELQLELRDGPLHLRGLVRWTNSGLRAPASRPAGMGVEFTEDDLEKAQAIRRILERELRRYRL